MIALSFSVGTVLTAHSQKCERTGVKGLKKGQRKEAIFFSLFVRKKKEMGREKRKCNNSRSFGENHNPLGGAPTQGEQTSGTGKTQPVGKNGVRYTVMLPSCLVSYAYVGKGGGFP